ncbi:hypothetical protein CARUB_v10006742mg, partial [Capsella rubella]
MDSQKEQKFISLVTDIIFLFSSTDLDSTLKSKIVSFFTQLISEDNTDSPYDKSHLAQQIHSPKPKVQFLSVVDQMYRSFFYKGLNPELKVVVSLITQVISLVLSSIDLDLKLQSKPEWEMISLIKKVISLFNSKPDSELELVSLISQFMHLGISVELDSELTQESDLLSLIRQLVSLKPVEEITTLIRKIISRFKSLNWQPKKFLFLSPQAVVKLRGGKFCATQENLHGMKQKGECSSTFFQFWRSTRKDCFYCLSCNGEGHDEGYEMAPVDVKHPLHPKHSLQLVWYKLWRYQKEKRKCFCCDVDLEKIFYYCAACDYAMNMACTDETPMLYVDHPKRHEHTLALFPRQQAFLICNVCALADASSPIYMCPPCDFVVHLRCISLPRLIRISRHPHRISFTTSFDQGDWLCGVCRTRIDNDYGGYFCTKDGCSYAAHSRCATQTNVWDGIELEGVPEEIEEELEPFVRISHGVIQHFSHEHHHLKLDENIGGVYDENKQCQACITPIYFGNFYSCMQCDFILHEKCANLSRKMHHPIHPHMLTLVVGYDKVEYFGNRCTACDVVCIGGLSYECSKEECGRFKLHVQCATISEPLRHESHVHPLFLTSKPGEQRTCGVCQENENETFNCIKECGFALCFACATIPHK